MAGSVSPEMTDRKGFQLAPLPRVLRERHVSARRALLGVRSRTTIGSAGCPSGTVGSVALGAAGFRRTSATNRAMRSGRRPEVRRAQVRLLTVTRFASAVGRERDGLRRCDQGQVQYSLRRSGRAFLQAGLDRFAGPGCTDPVAHLAGSFTQDRCRAICRSGRQPWRPHGAVRRERRAVGVAARCARRCRSTTITLADFRAQTSAQ